ncbi:ASB18 [Branchiostoma lanceolatum]|uniref:ASB18 protein n=1 Tax=Branchiostoma lanceolatum TaxID=7740 RepID=A0A8J9ZI23_BRALA|nr:ASB18 [Branchiostoma lanceolatum]
MDFIKDFCKGSFESLSDAQEGFLEKLLKCLEREEKWTKEDACWFYSVVNEGDLKNMLKMLNRHVGQVDAKLEVQYKNNDELMEYIYQKGDVRQVAPGVWQMVYDTEYVTPLYVTAKNGYVDCMRHLLNRQADVDYAPSGWTPLHAAVDAGHVDCVRLLLDYGADVTMETDDGLIVLHLCCKSGEEYVKCAEVLLKASTEKINEKSWDKQQTPLHMAASKGLGELVGLLLEKGADPNVRDLDKETPLLLAAYLTTGDDGYLMTCRKLVEAGADVNVQDSENQIALHKACRNGDHRIATLLAVSGSEINHRDYYFKTPLFEAIAATELLARGYSKDAVKGQPEGCVQAMVNNGAWRVYPTEFHQILAQCAGHPPTIEVLVNSYASVQITALWRESIPDDVMEEHGDFYRAFLNLGKSPATLQHLARSSMRKVFGKKCQKVVDGLPIAPGLKKYILLVPGEAGMH